MIDSKGKIVSAFLLTRLRGDGRIGVERIGLLIMTTSEAIEVKHRLYEIWVSSDKQYDFNRTHDQRTVCSPWKGKEGTWRIVPYLVLPPPMGRTTGKDYLSWIKM